MDENVQQKLLAEVEALLEPVVGAAMSAGRRQALFATLGWDPGAAVGMSAAELDEWLGHSASVVEGVQRFAADPPDTLPELADALAVTSDAVEAMRGFPPGLAGGGPTLPPADVLAGDLVTLVTTSFLERRHPKLYRLLILLTLLEPAEGRPVSDPIPATGDPIRLPIARPALRLDRLGPLLTDPVGTMKAAYFPNGLDTVEHAEAAADALFPRIAALLRELGGEALYGLDPDLAPPLDEAALALASHMLSVSWEIPLGEAVAHLGATFGLSAAETGGLGLLVVPTGRVELTHVVGGWALGLAA